LNSNHAKSMTHHNQTKELTTWFVIEKPLLSVLGLTRAGSKTSRQTKTNVSFSSRRIVAMCEHVDSTPPATSFQLVG
jgi:hypothetical protein